MRRLVIKAYLSIKTTNLPEMDLLKKRSRGNTEVCSSESKKSTIFPNSHKRRSTVQGLMLIAIRNLRYGR